MNECDIENRLIKQLTGPAQWEYCDNIKTVDQLWDNLREILDENNKALLCGTKLTDKEFDIIKANLTCSSTYAAADKLIGQNGQAHVNINRDGKTLNLLLFDRNSTFGNTRYQIVNQIQIPNNATMAKNNRRFDVTLLINGLPLIQIELKKSSESEMNAYEQIRKYESEGCYKGIYRFIHMFVISNGSVTKYFAAGDYIQISDSHLNIRRNKNNENITNLEKFTNEVLKRPMSYNIVTKYSILENDINSGIKRLILLRPYQIHAIEAIEKASKESKSGYIRHTTGSGKTLTSYKATRNLITDIPAIKKAIFLVDRKDLDQQTINSFKAYSEKDFIEVESTSSTRNLRKKIADDSRQVIVTTIQKLTKLLDELKKERSSENQYSNDYNKMIQKRVAFVVDECHRTVTPETMKEIRSFFRDSLRYGFTGTPRFEQNPYDNNGYARTTDELYGKTNNSKDKNCCLHMYTIENAIKDKAVLDFNISYIGLQIKEHDDPSYYCKEGHMLEVIKEIISKYNLYGIKNGQGNTFESILTVSNIKIAQKDYNLFKEIKNGKYKDKGIFVNKSILESLEDFPKVSISYSVKDDNDNADKYILDTKYMEESINDYNAMFNTQCSIENSDRFNYDLQNRLKRKGKKYQSRSEQLDIVIVVNRLLTGFDAIPIANLFIDRQPQELHSIIQMFSRTNRIAPDKFNKLHGNIITFQSPDLWQKKVKEAVSLFTNGGEKSAIAKSYPEVLKNYNCNYNALINFIDKYPDLDELATLPTDVQKIFISDIQNYDKSLKEIKTYFDFMDEKQGDASQELFSYDEDGKIIKREAINKIDENTLEQLRGHYNSIIKKFKTEKEIDFDDDIDVDYSLELVDKDLINLDYISRLIDTYKGDNSNNVLESDIEKYINSISKNNSKLGDIIKDCFEKIKATPEKYRDISSLSIIEQVKQEIINKLCKELSDQYNLNYEVLCNTAENYDNIVESIEDISNINLIVDHASIEGLIPFKAKRQARQKVLELLNNEIYPLNNSY